MSALARVERGEVLVNGEFPFTRTDFRTVAALLYEMAGITLPDSKATLVYSRLAKRLRKLGLRSFKDYCALVESREGAEELGHMVAALTTNVTRFFREPHHFDHLRTQLLPRLVERARAGGRVRMWSAGCSTGPEPYSMALTVLGALPDAGARDVRLLATDIDPNVVARARAGLYSDAEMNDVPAALRTMFVQRASNGWQAGAQLRDWIAFRELNLLSNWPMQGKFDAIFCRNVCIYFDEETQARLWARFAEKLAPGGRLYIGHSERAATSTLTSDGLTIYRLAGEPE